MPAPIQEYPQAEAPIQEFESPVAGRELTPEEIKVGISPKAYGVFQPSQFSTDPEFARQLFQQLPEDISKGLSKAAEAVAAPVASALKQFKESDIETKLISEVGPQAGTVPPETKGIGPSVARTAESLISPEGLAMLATPPAGVLAVGGAAAGIPGQIEAIAKAQSGPEFRGAVTDLALNLAQLALVAKGGSALIKGKPEVAELAKPEEIAPVAPQTAQALKTTTETIPKPTGERLTAPDPTPEEMGKIVGFEFKGVQPGAAIRRPTAEQLAAMPAEEKAIYEAISAKQGNQWEFTNPETGFTFYVKEGASLEEIQKRAAEKTETPKVETPSQVETLTAATYTNPKGEVFEGPTHIEAALKDNFKAPKTRKGRETPEYGFRTSTGRVVDRKEGLSIAEASGTLNVPRSKVLRGNLHSDQVKFTKPTEQKPAVEPTKPTEPPKAEPSKESESYSQGGWTQTDRGRDIYKADIAVENTKDTAVISAMKSSPSYPKLLAAYHRFQRSLRGKSYDPTAIERTPWEMLDASSGVMNAKSQMAKTLSSLEDAVFKESGLPRKEASRRFRGGTGVDWDKVEPIKPGPGAQTVGEPMKPELAQLTDAMRTLAEGQPKPELQRAYSLAERWQEGKDAVSAGLGKLQAVGTYLREKQRGLPTWDSIKGALGRRQVSNAESSLNAKEFVDKSLRAVPKPEDREAITDWLEAGGDPNLLTEFGVTTKPQYKAGYQRAKNLSPEQVKIAQNTQNYFESRFKDAEDAGLLEDATENYIHRIYEKDSKWKQDAIAEIRGGVFTGKPGLARKRFFQYDAEAEAAGYKPVKDFVQRVAHYDMALNKAIADRIYVKELLGVKMKDGRPAIDAAGVGIPIEGTEADAGALLIKPQVKSAGRVKPSEKSGISPEQAEALNNRTDYIAYDHPALRKWKWLSETEDGKPVMLQGNVLIHPDALKQINAVFGRSKVRQSPVGRTLMGIGSTIKQTMLDLSGFHPVQITVHGWEHRTFKPVEKLDMQDPVQRSLVSHGVVVPEWHGAQAFSEGLMGTSLTKYLPYLGPKLQAFKEAFFGDYIPRLKMAMAMHALERNRSKYSAHLADGRMTEDQLLHLTANEANAAFGELNYEMMARSKTTQDMLRLGLLAPDFLEARGRFAGQAFTRYGSEQRQALFLGAVTLYMLARIVNKLLDDQYHFETKNAFSVVYNKKAYSLRTVQGDVLHLITDPEKFFFNRLNPVYGRTALEALTRRDVFGRTRSRLQQLQDLAQTVVPISMRGLLNPREQTLFESFLNSVGVTERRDTANDEIYKLADAFKKKRNIGLPGEFIYDPERDPYRGVKISLAYGTPEQAAQEMLVLHRDKGVDSKRIESFVTRFATAPFTGSRKNDREFYLSLSEDQKKSFNRAVNERKRMRQNLRKANSIYRHNLSGTTPTPIQEY